MFEFDKLNEALKDEGYNLKIQLLRISGNYIAKICVIEDATQIIIHHSSSLEDTKKFIKFEFGRKWMEDNNIN